MTSRQGRSRNRRSRSELVVIYWRDIPAQVTARFGEEKMAVTLHRRFQAAIDRAAMVAGKKTYDEYISEWRRTSRPCQGNVEEEARRAAARLEQEYPSDRVRAIASNGGFEESASEEGTS
ncbi:MAG: virulence factor [bacterium]|nr:virulence factor [bacterium]MXX63757.1 hypothetical protein [Acidimicrobiia bacterium]MCY3580401.1 virulence factor [bacterium]MCY3651913.1 virulence factor [bacterium]MDE0644277.1 virulence factor [bacterium]